MEINNQIKEIESYDFEYLGKRYKWLKDFQGEIDCPGKDCQKFVRSLIKSGRLKETQNENK